MRLSRFEKLTLAWCLVLLAYSAALFWADAKAATPVKKTRELGPFDLVLRYSHHARASDTSYPVLPRDEGSVEWVDVVDHVDTVGPFSGWDTCDGAALEAQGRQQDPAHDAYVTASCLYLGPRRP